ncbi:MAG TPA: hypothetical protein VHT27_08530 [Solirubrobacteraceae bacterium]|jgi:hypothetical protein|nr:hypothetical protein [Solirubrobacteraceae bacterium]
MRRIRWLTERLSYANVVATLALFVALGGASYAAVELPPGSVGARQLRTAAVSPAALGFPLGLATLAGAKPDRLGKGRCDGEPPGPEERPIPCPVAGSSAAPPSPTFALRFHLRAQSRVLLTGVLRLEDTQTPGAGSAAIGADVLDIDSTREGPARHSTAHFVLYKQLTVADGQTLESPLEAVLDLQAGSHELGLINLVPTYSSRSPGEVIVVPDSLVAITMPALAER